MEDWKDKLSEGRRCVDNDDFTRARNFLEQALEGCPDEETSAAADILFEIGRSFFGQGMRGLALKNMIAAVKLGSTAAYAENMLRHLVNEYGMPVQRTSELDDRAAFTAIHILRYLHTKRSARFGTEAERDMINDLISEAWADFRNSCSLGGLRTRQKIQKFREYVIFFPSFTVPDMEEKTRVSILFPDFGNDTCSCGSGLPYSWCCGRIKTTEELDNGVF